MRDVEDWFTENERWTRAQRRAELQRSASESSTPTAAPALVSASRELQKVPLGTLTSIARLSGPEIASLGNQFFSPMNPVLPPDDDNNGPGAVEMPPGTNSQPLLQLSQS